MASADTRPTPPGEDAVQNALDKLLMEKERRLADEALRSSEQKYKLLFEANPMPMWMFSRKTMQIIDVNEAATEHYGNNEVGQRRDNQQQRIANGIRSGQMSPSEASKAEAHEQNINHQVATDRQANGGKLTPAEKKNINQKQNNASKQIYNDKHNEKKAPK